MESQEAVLDKPKRGRPRKTVEEVAIPEVPSEPTPEPAEPVNINRARKKPDPETAVQSDVAFTSKRGDVNFKAMRAPPKPKLERSTAQPARPYSHLHDRYSVYTSPYAHFAIT